MIPINQRKDPDSMGPTIGHTATRMIHIPEIEFFRLSDGLKTEALRGYTHVVAVMNQKDECLGWMEVKEETPIK